jgi:hypothetical protein
MVEILVPKLLRELVLQPGIHPRAHPHILLELDANGKVVEPPFKVFDLNALMENLPGRRALKPFESFSFNLSGDWHRGTATCSTLKSPSKWP